MKGKIPHTVTSILELVRRIVSLYLESAKLTFAEKSALLLSGALLLLVVLVLGIFALAFFSGTCIELLSLVLPAWAGDAIMGGFFVLLIIICLVFRKALFVNPIARYMSKMVFDKDQKNLS